MGTAWKRDIPTFLIAVIVSAWLFRAWLTLPVLDVLSVNQWRAFGMAVALLAGGLSKAGNLRVSIFVTALAVGLLVGGTLAALPVFHGSMSDAFESNLDSVGLEIIAFTLSSAIGVFFVSWF